MINQDFNSILELINAFPNDEVCIEHLEELRWGGVVVSPFDENSKVYKCANSRYRCKNTGKYFNVKTGTIFDNTKMPLQKWFLAIWLVTSHKKGISSLQLSRDIDVTQKSAWFMLQRIRNCFGITDNDDNSLGWDVEIDETYVGGKNKNRHYNKKVPHSQGRSSKDKTPVVWMVERWGKVLAKKVNNVQAKTLTREVTRYVKETANVYTDEWLGYKTVKKMYTHSIVNHGSWEYVRWNAYTNTIEGFWSLLKRGILGIYHSTSKKHLQKYVDEFVFRYNTRDMSEWERFNTLLMNCDFRLTYNQLKNG